MNKIGFDVGEPSGVNKPTIGVYCGVAAVTTYLNIDPNKVAFHQN
jgi:hypothetical protein